METDENEILDDSAESHNSGHDDADGMGTFSDELDEEDDNWDTVRDVSNPESRYDEMDNPPPDEELDEEDDNWDTVRDDAGTNPNLEFFEEEMNDYDEIDD
ncbi:MAG: hypothetical protein B0D92_00490 [Spirochaeta sp. LUC14_002_19_P3]|nr:MAG: hypothetical protein B0D92_00490 [Spirochaeta sp. LUC14_002_19_P3]